MLLLCRHGEGDHNIGRNFPHNVGPSLTSKGVRQATSDVIEGIHKSGYKPSVILVSPQLRAIQTAAFARLSTELRKLPVKIHPLCYEQTVCIWDQGNVIPSLDVVWEYQNVINSDRKLVKEIRKTLPSLSEPNKDKRGSAKSRAKEIIKSIKQEYNGANVLLICHDGIARDIIFAQTGKRSEILYNCEVRPLDIKRKGKSLKRTNEKK